MFCVRGHTGVVDAQARAPGSRELALLAADKPEDKDVHAIVLTGGSAGLATPMAMRYLAERGLSSDADSAQAHVPAAVVGDFSSIRAFTPDAAGGYEACGG